MTTQLKLTMLMACASFCVWQCKGNTETPQVTGKVASGVWLENFAAATNLAYTTKTPLILFWGNDLCPECAKLEAAFVTDSFKNWQSDHDYFVYCLVIGSSGNDVGVNKGSGAKEFASTAAGALNTSNRLKQYPFVCLWWPQDDGTVSVVNFVGRTGLMGVPQSTQMDEKRLANHDSEMLKLLANEFERAVEKAFKGYAPESLPTFVASNTIGNRLEAEPKTAIVPVPLKRDGGSATTNVLRVAWSEGGGWGDYEVLWSKGQKTASVDVSMTPPSGSAFTPGQSLGLTLFDNAGNVIATSEIACVDEQENSEENPYWVGEKTAQTLDWSDWTLDYDIVKQKVSDCSAAGMNAYTLAVFSGTTWCPYCKAIKASLFDSDEFKSWLGKNHVQIALFDQGLSPSDAYPGAGHLLTYEAGLEHYSPAGSQIMVSGAGYMSRHEIKESDLQAQSVHARSVDYSFSKWLAPESKAVRLSNPTILLIDGNDRVVGRYSSWRDSNNTLGFGNKYYDPNENITRLDDLLLLAERGSESSDYCSTTTRVLAPNSTATATFQINDRNECFLLKDLSTGTLTFSAKAPRDIALSFIVDGEIVSSGVNSLQVSVARSHLSASRICLKASGAMPAKLDGVSSVYEATIAATIEESAANGLFTGFQQSIVLGTIDCSTTAKVSVHKLSGSIPPGMKLAFDTATHAAMLIGTPKKAGAYTLSYQAAVRDSGTTSITKSEDIAFDIEDPATRNIYVNLNANYAVPLVASSLDGSLELGGTIVVTTKRNGLIGAKFQPVTGRAVSFSGRWSSLDATDNVAEAHLFKSGTELYMRLSPSGELSIEIDGLSGCTAYGEMATYDGSYTVTFPTIASDGNCPYLGTGVAMLTVKRGIAAVKIMLPNGTKFNMKTYLSLDPTDREYALLPIMKCAAKDTFSALLRIRANGASLYSDSETAAVILSANGISAQWSHHEPKSSFESMLDVYGGYYDKSLGEDGYFRLFGLHGTVLVIDGVPVEAKYRLTKNTGMFSGSANLTRLDGSVVPGKFMGVLLPGWIDCNCGDSVIERPFASGAFIYKENGTTQSVPADLRAE